jgi:uncharacterized protein (DUF983 family)
MTESHLPAPDPSVRNLPPRGGKRLRTLLARAFQRRCPQCGNNGIFKNYFEMKHSCPSCGYRFDREEGYFLGAYAVNLLLAEFIPVGLLILFLIYSSYSWVTLELIFIPLAIIMPLLFFPYSRMLWMVLDLYVDPNEHTERQLRQEHLARPGSTRRS